MKVFDLTIVGDRREGRNDSYHVGDVSLPETPRKGDRIYLNPEDDPLTVYLVIYSEDSKIIELHCIY